MAHALVLGASGISGWSIVNQALTYPTPTTFSRITGTTNRPLTLEEARLPPDGRVQLVSGVDFTKTVDEVVAALKELIPDVHTVTHVFFTAYIQTDDFESLRDVNTGLLDVAVRAIEKVAPELATFILQTGGKGYGLEFPDKLNIITPLKESHPRIPEPWASNIFYYTQHDRLASLSKGKKWTFSEIRPDGIVGFAPRSNAMNLAQGLGLYLSIFRAVHGAGAAAPFPGTVRSWSCRHSDTFQDVLSKMEIFAAVNTDRCGGGGVFNCADGEVVTWSQVWPVLAQHFGLVGTGPGDEVIELEEFVTTHRSAWAGLVQAHGLREQTVDEQNWGFVSFMIVQFDYDRQYDLSRAREVGFTETIDTAPGYIAAWNRMREAKILPPQ